MALQRVEILGVQVSALNMPLVLETLDAWLDTRERHYVCVTGVHGIMESWRDEQLRRIHNDAGMVTPDGMPLVWISRLMGHHGVARVYGPDLMLAACEAFVGRNCRHFFYGGAPRVAETLAAVLSRRFPGLQVAGTYCPPFRDLTTDEQADVNDRINRSRADIVWVGISTPRQERWMARHLGELGAPVLIGVGAAFDFHAGIKRQAPVWMQRNGLEWLFRLGTEPRRLWKRYLVNNPSFVALVLLQFAGLSPGRRT